MPKKLFISHYSRDKALAAILSEAIFRISHQRILCWTYLDGEAGNKWEEEIKSQLFSSHAMIVLITPQNMDNWWIGIEIGIALGLNKPIIPVYLHVKQEEIREPLKSYTCYPLHDYPSCIKFISKLFGLFRINYDAGMEFLLQRMMMDLLSAAQFDGQDCCRVQPDIDQVIKDIKDRLDGLANDLRYNGQPG